MYTDLTKELSELDKKRIHNYITTYGIHQDFFIGVDEWLQNWSHSKQKLFHLLGDKLIVEIPFCVKKNEENIRREMNEIIWNSPFCQHYNTWVYALGDHNVIPPEYRYAFKDFVNLSHLSNNKTVRSIKYKRESKKNTLQLQAGTKTIRAIQKVLNYFDDLAPAVLKEEFEEFRVKHSMVFNEKEIKGSLCLSIHPLDFMTMSDNSLNWSSCMSWTDDGCYHAGTVEMMNSNNVLCCYLKSNNQTYIFNKKNENVEENSWNNKKWRQLFYATKDIISSGKAYPYYNEDLTLRILNLLKDLATDNVHWNYQYDDPEPYLDMIHVSSNYRMNRNRDWMHNGGSFKHNILFDTKGMYNDMLNDNDYQYWCIRNKVPKMKIISVSGKCNCLGCNRQVVVENDCCDDYNDRFENTGKVVCNDCGNELPCDYCSSSSALIKVHRYGSKYICNECLKKFFKVCPCCGQIFDYDNIIGFSLYYTDNFKGIDRIIYISPYKEDENLSNFESSYKALFNPVVDENETKAERIFVCPECYDKIKNNQMDVEKIHFTKEFGWREDKDCYLITDKRFQKALLRNLDPVDPEVAKEFLKNS